MRSYSAELLTTVRPATEQEWRTRAISARVTLDEPVIDAAVRLTRARVNRGVRSVRRQSGRSCWAAGLFDRRAADISDRAGDLRDLYAQLFVGRLLGVEPLEQPEEIITISPLDIGNLIHYSMDEFIRDRAASLPTFGAPWTADLDSMLDGRQRLARRARRAGGGQRI